MSEPIRKAHAVVIIDSDVDPRKDKQLEKADAAAGEEVKVIVSSPCFEIWYPPSET